MVIIIKILKKKEVLIIKVVIQILSLVEGKQENHLRWINILRRKLLIIINLISSNWVDVIFFNLKFSLEIIAVLKNKCLILIILI